MVVSSLEWTVRRHLNVKIKKKFTQLISMMTQDWYIENLSGP